MLRIIVLLAMFLCGRLQAGNPFQIQGQVLSSAGTVGSASTANSYAQVTLFRANSAQVAKQVLGPDANFPNRIFPAGKYPAYYLTDAGSQWSNAVTKNQAIYAVLETAPGLNGWAGDAFAAACSASVTAQGGFGYASSSCILPTVSLVAIPKPVLSNSDASFIDLQIGRFNDASGMAFGLALFKRSSGASNWEWIADLSNTPASQTFRDLTVTAGDSYEYAVAVNYAWPGGGGAGSLPGQSGRYTTLSLATAGPFTAQSLKHSPTLVLQAAMPEGWILYPNPVYSGTVNLAFNASGSGNYLWQIYNLQGEKVREVVGKIAGNGAQTEVVDINSLASGIYLTRLQLDLSSQGISYLGWKKLAIAH